MTQICTAKLTGFKAKCLQYDATNIEAIKTLTSKACTNNCFDYTPIRGEKPDNYKLSKDDYILIIVTKVGTNYLAVPKAEFDAAWTIDE